MKGRLGNSSRLSHFGAFVKLPDSSTEELAIKPFVIAAGIILATCVAFGCVMMLLWYDRPDQRGIFGDMFGALNTLFSGLAFAGVIYAILLQRHELRLQRQELEDTRQELHRSAIAQEKSQEALTQQVAALNETVRISQQSIQPQVIVYAAADESRPSIILLVVENVGRGVARNVRFKYPKGMPRSAWGIEGPDKDGYKLMDCGPLATGIPFLPPGGTRKLAWGQYGGLHSVLRDKPMKVTAEFENLEGQSQPLINSYVDVKSFEFTDATDPDGARQAARHLEKIARDIGRLTTGFKPPVVLVQSKAQYDRKQKEVIDAIKEKRANKAGESDSRGSVREISAPPSDVSTMNSEFKEHQ